MNPEELLMNEQEETQIPAEKDLSEQQLIRRQKLEKLKDSGRNPFTMLVWNQTHHSAEIKEQFEALENKTVSIAGRIMSFRDIGKASFLDIQDREDRKSVV
mgnify:FL=1